MIFSMHTSEDSSPTKRWVSNAAFLALTLAATAVMMLCTCDVVGIHDYGAISLVGVAAVFGIAAATVAYRRMSPESGRTGFFRAVIALAIAGISIFVELLLAQELVALMARRQ